MNSERSYPVFGGPFDGHRFSMEIPDDLRYGRIPDDLRYSGINYGDQPIGEYQFAISAWIWREKRMNEVDQGYLKMQETTLAQIQQSILPGLGQSPNPYPHLQQWQLPISQRQPSVEETPRMVALRLAFEHVEGDWQEAIRAARDILVFLQDG
jgi:hypothetical protein